MTNKSKKNIRQSFLIAIPLLIIWALLLIHSNHVQCDNFKEKIISNNVTNNENSSYLVSSYISNLIDSSKIFSHSNLIQQYLDETNSKNEQLLRNKFIQTVCDDTEISKINFYDLHSNKEISVEYTEEDSIISYTKEINNTDENLYLWNNFNVIVSSFTVLNNPLSSYNKAKIKFLIPLFNEEDILIGQLAITYNADNLIEILMKYSAFVDKNAHLLVLEKSKEGSYIISSRSCNSLDLPDVDCDYVVNSILEKSNSTDSGYLILDDYLFTYFNVLSKVDSLNILNNEKWVIVNNYNIGQKYSIKNLLKNIFNSYYGVIFLIIIFFSILAAYFINRLRINKEEINLAKMVAETTTDSVVILDNKLCITYVNIAFENLSGYKSEELLGKSIKYINVDIKRHFMNEETLKSIIANRTWTGDVWQQKRNGLFFPVRLNIFATASTSIEQQFIGMISDLTNSNAISISDDNSLNYNGKIIYDLLSRNIIRYHKYVLIYIIVENHRELRDLVAKEHIDIIETLVSIIVPKIGVKDIVVKTGQYVINVLSNIDNIEDSPSNYVKKLHDLLSKSVKVGNHDVFFKTTLGASLYPNDTLDIKQLFTNSSIASDWNTIIGKIDFSMYNFKMKEDIKREKLIIKNLRYALENNEFYMNYQPQVDIQKGCIIGIEALIRWNNKELGFISPAEFIPIAENNHIMSDLGKWIIEEVASNLKYMFTKLDLNDNQFRCAINVSSLQLEDEEFLKHLYASIEANNLSYKNIEIEITENSFLDQIKRTKPILDNICSRGITIAIDDFGTGYSSLSYLNRIPIDKIKIDRGFIKDFPSGDNGELAKFLVKMSKTLKKDVLTEGAETEEQARYLKNIGCQFIQGYYYSKPLSVESTIEYIQNFKFEDF